ncbi:MAG: hypothetical protein P4L40_20670 [Terracidiphilus sp.]|nr:hypothetical protein [Terracidiphilus sp.]
MLLSSVCFLSGCFASARLYPVKGPLAEQTPPPIYAARVAAGFHSGSFTATLANGTKCSGQWTRVSRKPHEAGAGAPTDTLAAAWDAVYGPGFYTTNVLGTAIHIEGQIPCGAGGNLHVEAVQHEIGGGQDATLVIKGVATDDSGNIYKLAF